jgi:hypothetical protein
MAFFVTIGAMIVRIAELPNSAGYEPYLMERGWNPIAARGMAALMVRHGNRRADESQRGRRSPKPSDSLANIGDRHARFYRAPKLFSQNRTRRRSSKRFLPTPAEAPENL